MKQNPLSYFFTPRGVAIIGASLDPEKLSHRILKNAISYNFQGKVYPVNPKASEILGLPCYPDIEHVPDPVELAVVVVPVQITLATVEACGKRGVKAVIVISGGFKEVGPEGQALEEKIAETARSYGMRMIGPNCVGTMDLYSGLNTTFIPGMPDQGGIGFLSQSGAICGGIVNLVIGKHIGFSHFVSMGNEADVSETDVMEYLADDPRTRVIVAYVEAIRDGAHFMETARKISAKKPVVILKAGKTSAGARAVSSHTGSLAGTHAAYKAAFQQSGVIEVESLADLFDVAVSLDYQPLPKGKKCVVLTNSGGPAALASDQLGISGLEMADLLPQTKQNLRKFLNPSAQVDNPVDMLGGAMAPDYGQAMLELIKDPGVDVLIPLLTPIAQIQSDTVAEEISRVAQGCPKTIISCFIGDEIVKKACNELHHHHVPMLIYPESLGRVIAAMYHYGEQREGVALKLERLDGIDQKVTKDLLAKAPVKTLGEALVRPMLESYGIKIVAGEVTHSPDEAAQAAARMGFPVVVKIISPDILHKSDAGGIVLNLKDEGEVKIGYQQMMERVIKNAPQAKLEGVLVERMTLARGQEVIVGMRRDPNFGPLMMFGLGGIYVELFKDVEFRVAPLGREEALDMIHKTQAGRLLTGFRGAPVLDVDAVVDCILRLAQMALDFPQIQEVEVNPLFVLPQGQGAVALDCRAIIE